MKIAIDISPLKKGHFLQHRVRGTGFYLEHLKNGLLNYFPEHQYIFFTKGDKLPQDVDVVHYPYFEPFFLVLPFFTKHKMVVTVHDLTPLAFPEFFPCGIKGKIKWEIQKFILRKSSAIITDSLSSKKDLITYAGVREKDIHVVYLAGGEEFNKIQLIKSEIQRLRKKYTLPEKFALYVGDITWNKNLPRLINAIKRTRFPLVLVGKALVERNFDSKNPWNQDLVTVHKLLEDDRQCILLGFVETDDLVKLYNLAMVFVMPSLYEGFGLPILEAMSCGCPVITSREGSIPEVAGDGAYYVDGYDENSIAEGIQKVWSDEKLRQTLKEKGLKQTKKFSWKQTARETLAVYKSILKT